MADAKLAEHIAICEAAFPNYNLAIEDLIAEGDLVVLRATFMGHIRARSQVSHRLAGTLQ